MTNPNYIRKAQDLIHGNRIIDPEGEVAIVRRIRRIDHQRGLLETDRGVAQVGLEDVFQLVILPPPAPERGLRSVLSDPVC